jgi:hypothetical protein
MKIINILYNPVVGILAALGLPIAVTNLLASISLAAIALGIIILSPQVALIVAVIIFASLLF